MSAIMKKILLFSILTFVMVYFIAQDRIFLPISKSSNKCNETGAKLNLLEVTKEEKILNFETDGQNNTSLKSTKPEPEPGGGYREVGEVEKDSGKTDLSYPTDLVPQGEPASIGRTVPEKYPRRTPDNGSAALPLRGPGDSYLPFQDKFVPQFLKMPNEFGKEAEDIEFKNPLLKKILVWNTFNNKMTYYMGFGREKFIRARCKVDTCLITANRTRYIPEEIDALIWHGNSLDQTLPTERSPHTRFVYWMMEPPPHVKSNFNTYRNLFNWTSTYRKDSDIPNLYGIVYRLRQPSQVTVDYRNVTSGKTKLAAWFVSNCHGESGRNDFVKAMQKVMQVDVYGRCGPFNCTRKDEEACRKMVEKNYKFYLSFENSLCLDYVTEKFFRMLEINVVPVVFGSAKYSDVVPPHSYINALDFNSPEELAKYLLYLDKNDTAYIEYFQWKKYHHLSTPIDRRMKEFCDLCELLHTDHKPKTYDLEDWFISQSQCRSWKNGKLIP